MIIMLILFCVIRFIISCSRITRPLLTFHVPILILLILFTLTLVLFVMLCDCSFGLGVPCFLVTRIGFVGLPMLAEIPAEEFGEPKFEVLVEVALGELELFSRSAFLPSSFVTLPPLCLGPLENDDLLV